MDHDLALAGPILLPAMAAILLILVDLLPGRGKSQGSFFLGSVGALISLVYSVYYLMDGRTGKAFSGTLEIDESTLIIAIIVHGSALLSMFLSREYFRNRPDVEQPEYHAFILVSATGMVTLAAANDLVNVFLGIEILSIPLYILTAIRRQNARSVEAGAKYLLLGAFASAFLVFGMGLLYGASGTTMLSALPAEMARLGTGDGLAALGVCFFLVGILFKVAAAPFHMWTPDVYEGAPTPVTAFMATATKAAVFGALIRFAPTIATGLGPEFGATILGGIAILTMVVGNFGALRQQNLKRLLAYSSIAHAGYMLVGLAAVVQMDGQPGAETGASAILFYLSAYVFMNLGAFAVAVVLDRGQGREGVDELRGLGREKPALAAAMAVFALAMAGIPPTAGFFGKFFVFTAAVDAGLYTLAVIAVLMSVVGLYYYLRILILMYMGSPEESEARTLKVDGFITLTSLIAVGAVLYLGILPDWLMKLVEGAMGG